MVIDQVGSIGIPKDAKRRANFEKLMMGQDQQLSAKVNKMKNQVKARMHQ